MPVLVSDVINTCFFVSFCLSDSFDRANLVLVPTPVIHYRMIEQFLSAFFVLLSVFVIRSARANIINNKNIKFNDKWFVLLMLID